MNPNKPFSIKKSETSNAKKYDNILAFDPLSSLERSSKSKKERKGAGNPIQPEFLEKVMKIKNNKMAPTLQITTERSQRDTIRGTTSTSDFYAIGQNSSVNLSGRNLSQSRGPGGMPYLTTSFTKSSPKHDEYLLTHKTQFHAHTDARPENNLNLSSLSSKNKVDGQGTTHFEPVLLPSPLINKFNQSMTEIYDNLGEMTNQIKSILDSKHDEKIQLYVMNNNWKQALDLQQFRVENLMSIIDHKPQIFSSTTPNKILQDLNRIVKIELHRIAHSYENAISQLLQRATHKVKAVLDRPAKVEMDITGAMRSLIEYCHFYRVEGVTREGFDKEQKMIQITEEINEYKLHARLKKNLDVKMIDTFEELENIVKELNVTIRHQQADYAKLAEENKKLIETSKNDIKKFREDNLELIKKHFENKKNDIVPQDQAMPVFKEKHFQMRITDLENKIKDYQERLKNYEDKYRKAKAELTVLQKNPDNQRKKMVDAAVEVNLYSEKREKIKLLSLGEIVTFKGDLTGGTQTFTWLNNVISMIYNDKLIADMCDDYERRPRKLLREYLPEWFFKRFGLFSVCETLLKDFVHNLKRFGHEHDRYSQFCALAGIHFGNRTVKDTKKHYDEAELKLMSLSRLKEFFYQSIDAQIMFFKLCWFIKQSSYSGFLNAPFIPSLDAGGAEVIPIEAARQAMSQLATEEKYDPEKIRRLEEKFGEKLGTDLYMRVADEKPDTQQHKEGEDKYVRFDFIVRFILEHFMELRIHDLDTLLTTMKLNQINKIDYNLSIDEFQLCCQTKFPKPEESKSQAWQEHAFTALFDEPNADKIQFERLLPRIIPEITLQSTAKEFYLKVPGGSAWFTKDSQKDKKSSQNNKDLKLISLQISSRYNPKMFNKSGAAFVPSSLFNSVTMLYDCVSSITLLFESYEIFKDKFGALQDKMEHLEYMHEELKEDLGRLPQGLQRMTKYDIFQQYNMPDLVVYIEGCWKKFRVILGISMRINVS